MPGHADAEHEQIAEPEGQAGQKADLGDVDRGQAVIRIDPEADRAAGKDGGADIVADGVAGEARHRRDAVGHVVLADGSQREEIVKGQRAERADHAQRGQPDAMRRDLGQRGQDDAGIDALQGPHQVVTARTMMRRLAATPSRFQPILSLKPRPSVVSSRCIHPPGGAAIREGPVTRGDRRRSKAPYAKTHKAKTAPLCSP